MTAAANKTIGFLSLVWGLFALPPHAQAILGGDAGLALKPHLVMIVSDHGSLCSGVVLDRRVILTAAHCVSGGGSYRLHWRNETNQPVLAEPAQIIRHPDFKADAVKTRQRSVDLAILTSKTDLPPSFEPVTLVQAATPPPAKDSRLTIAGYGLRHEHDPNSAGQFATVTLPVIMPYGPGRILVWLGGKQSGACAGDSGGGIFNEDGHLVAVTIWSEGQGKNNCGTLTQGLLIAPQHGWIARELGRLKQAQ
jgi:hypothetical protein